VAAAVTFHVFFCFGSPKKCVFVSRLKKKKVALFSFDSCGLTDLVDRRLCGNNDLHYPS
jgi:hypothetical protein